MLSRETRDARRETNNTNGKLLLLIIPAEAGIRFNDNELYTRVFENHDKNSLLSKKKNLNRRGRRGSQRKTSE